MKGWDVLDKQPRRALWVWKPSTRDLWDGKESWKRLIDNYKGSADLLIDFCRNKSIKDIYLYIGTWSSEKFLFGKAQLYNEEGYAYIIGKAKQFGMRVFALSFLGDDPNDFSEYSDAAAGMVDALFFYNERYPEASFYGLQLDQEPFDVEAYSDYLAMLESFRKHIESYRENGSSIVFSAALRPQWVHETFSHKGETKPFYQYVLERLEHAALMAYYDTHEAILGVSLPVVEYATSLGKSVAVGVETGWFNVEPPNTFFERIKLEDDSTKFSYLERELDEVVEALAPYRGFERIAIHSWAQYFYHWFGSDPAEWLDEGNFPFGVSYVDLRADFVPS